MEFDKIKLWDLRKEVPLCSLFTRDFENSFGITANSCQDFFDSYADYLDEIMTDDGIANNDYMEHLKDYDTPDNLWDWYNCYEGCPFIFKED